MVEAVDLEEGAPVEDGKMLNAKEKKSLHEFVIKTEAEIDAEIHIAFYKTSSQADVLEEAKTYFHKQKLHHHPRKNNILIYILEQDRKFAILGDEGIHKKVSETYWSDLSVKLSEQFKKGNFYQGLVDCIAQLKSVFN